MKKIVCLVLLLSAGFIFKSSVSVTTIVHDAKGSYDLSHPFEKHVLPPVLNEISGLTDVNEGEVGCVQDEQGIIFIYDLRSKKLKQQINFGVNGDYEGLTRVEKDMYVLRSDGVIIEVKNYKEKNPAKHVYQLNIPTVNNEGLCYDESKKQLLIAAKSKAGKGELKDKRLVYAFDLQQKKLIMKPVLEIDIAELAGFAKRKGIKLPEAPRKKGEGMRSLFRFLPSSIAIHPGTGSIYVISAIDRTLAVFDNSGKVIDFQVLDKDVFSKPEGITFFANGDFLISNEAEGAPPTLLKFEYNTK